MPLNLIADRWIPVLDHAGTERVIAPWQIADPALARLDWPRPDLNIACLELLIGLMFLADPPQDAEAWEARQRPDPDRLRDRLAAFAPAFDLLGDGPRFMQDRARLEGEANPLDMLFIDSAGGQTTRNNADLMVWRDRYPALEPALAAMAIYTLQAFAPSGGAGNRTSMRGGGPMVTLVAPEGGGLWDLVWANVPDGTPGSTGDLPWMRATATSETGQQVFPEQTHPVEAFFGMPRRLRLVADGERITGVIQRPYGTNYAGWDHPLTPYYRLKLTTEWLPKHPRAGRFGYPNWLGTVIASERDSGLMRRAQMLRAWGERGNGRAARVIVAGWAMDNMKPRDFILSTPPLLDLPPETAEAVVGMVEAADLFSLALRNALGPVMAEGEAREAVREAFYAETQADFEAALTADVGEATARIWLAAMRRVALHLFEARALPGLADRDSADQQAIVQAHRNLCGAFNGFGAYGGKAFAQLGLPAPARKQEAA
ncbi:type I-E CRISPR-associated protein Cse1/CasA [Paracoccus sp. p4-l81]|uniref:type I-E CRISPR-associated protein Cse1/CasA n=1 Tax=Paracoccus sp. p4-l81 TaxID=3342806 RepID=UPI0035B8A40B